MSMYFGILREHVIPSVDIAATEQIAFPGECIEAWRVFCPGKSSKTPLFF